MIAHDQPTIFGASVVAALSSKKDGNLKFGLGDDKVALANRKAFLEKAGVAIEDTSLIAITYDTTDFTKYRIVTDDEKMRGMVQSKAAQHADALVVTKPHHALFLPLADCAGVILFDPEHRVLMVSHLGRHSVEQNGAHKSVRYLMEHYQTNPQKILVWISPSVGKATYPLEAFEGKGLQEVITTQFQAAGALRHNIETSSVDTAHDENYYSHSQFLKGNDTEAGRFAIVAMMIAQGEPAR